MSFQQRQRQERMRLLESLETSSSQSSSASGIVDVPILPVITTVNSNSSYDDCDDHEDDETTARRQRQPATVPKNGGVTLRSPTRLPSRRRPEEAVDSASGDTNINANNAELPKASLQDRVEELETKLAVLSMLLQRTLTYNSKSRAAEADYRTNIGNANAHANSNGHIPDDIMGVTPPLQPDDELPSPQTPTDPLSSTGGSNISSQSSVPHLESPAPCTWGKTPPRSHRALSPGMIVIPEQLQQQQSQSHQQNQSQQSQSRHDKDKHSENNTLGMISNDDDDGMDGDDDDDDSDSDNFKDTPPRANGSRMQSKLQSKFQSKLQLPVEQQQQEQKVRGGIASLFVEPQPRGGGDNIKANGNQNNNSSNKNGGVHHQHNLSFSLLYENDEEAEYQKEKRNQTVPPALSSLTLAERSWLRPKMLQFNTERRREQEERDAKDQQEQEQQQQLEDDTVRNKWLNYLNSFQESTPDVDVQMQEFIKVPGMVEHVMGFGIFICVDSFLYMVTILPIRFVWSCFLLLLQLFKPASPAFQFHRRHTYQMIQVFILYTIYRYVLLPISVGKLYHWIRGQAMIKLYVITAMVEVFDRLMCSLGQDCLDSMYWNTVSRPRSSRMIVSVLVVLVYATIHAMILFVHVETLNVAMNSADQALLTLLISGNFAEIKSTVFKKYNKAALFKITASDVCERFKLSLFLSLVLLLNLCQGMDASMFHSYMRTCGIIWCAEVLADWIKHTFITKVSTVRATMPLVRYETNSVHFWERLVLRGTDQTIQ
jgi:hypothetical protein